MSTIMPRKAAEFWWNLPMEGVERPKFVCPPEVSFYKKDVHDRQFVPVTWKEVFAERKKKQESHIRSKIGRKAQIKPCQIWVYYDDVNYVGAWLMYVRLHKRNIYVKDLMKSKVMDMFPCGVIPFDFNTWAEAFERKYHRNSKDRRRKKNALLKCWCLINESGEVKDIFPINKRPDYEKAKCVWS